jgi:hypothetical protein
MFRSFVRAALVAGALTIVGAGCGSDDSSDDSDAPADSAADSTTTGGTGADDTAGATTTSELPSPDESTFEGQARLVNFWLDDDGNTQDVDVWARRTFTNGPVLLAEGVAFGEASDYFGAPQGHSIVVTPAGAGSDVEELGGMFSPADGVQVTGVLVWEETGSVVGHHYERDASGVNETEEPPAAGMGLLILRAGQLYSFEDSLTDAGFGPSFYVGDGSTECLRQRVEDEGFTASILGGTQPVVLDLPAGDTTIAFHEWPGNDCTTDPLFELDVEIVEGETTIVYLYTSDGESLDHLELPVP